MNLPTWETYCDSTTAANALVFDLGPIRVYFSYKTPVAFHDFKGTLVVRSNEWGPTTGKHLNAIDGGAKGDRVPGHVFEAALRQALAMADCV